MPGTTSISGVISGLRTDEIIAKLMELERAPIVRLQAKKTTLSTRLTAWQDANTRVLAVKEKADLLAKGNTFDAKKLGSSDETILKGSASYQAQNGTYYLKINAMARAHQQKTDGFADPTTSVGTGTITIQVGSAAPTVITIDQSNNTLDGLRKAIETSGADVTATIVNDGSGPTPYRLVITSNTNGLAGQMTITNTLTGGTTPNLTDMQAAQDASVTLGEGAGAVTVTKGSNTIADLIPGVTLNLQQADAAKTITLTIQSDTEAVKKALTEFVEQYNNLIDFVNQQFKYDINTKTGGALFADSSLLQIQASIVTQVFSQVTGLTQTTTVLTQIGITSKTSDNKLAIDDTKLGESLSSGTDTVKRLFAAVGEATSSYITYIASTDKTLPSATAGYAIEITAVAAQARVTAGVFQTANLAQDEELTINGTTIQLTAGMTPAQVVSKINDYTSTTGVIASRTDITGLGAGDYLTLTRAAYGSGLTITAASAVSNGGGLGDNSGLGNVQVTESASGGEAGTGTGAAGADVAGTINGEAATGSGQILTGNTANTNTEGLRIRVTAGAIGSYGTITFTKGIGSLLADYLSFITEPGTGAVKFAQDSLQTQMRDIDSDIADLEERVAAKQERLIKQFTAMEVALSKLQSQGSFLASQLTAASSGWKQ